MFVLDLISMLLQVTPESSLQYYVSISGLHSCCIQLMWRDIFHCYSLGNGGVLDFFVLTSKICLFVDEEESPS